MAHEEYDGEQRRQGYVDDGAGQEQIHPGWTQQSQESYEAGNSGGWGGPGGPETGPLQLQPTADAAEIYDETYDVSAGGSGTYDAAGGATTYVAAADAGTYEEVTYVSPEDAPDTPLDRTFERAPEQVTDASLYQSSPGERPGAAYQAAEFPPPPGPAPFGAPAPGPFSYGPPTGGPYPGGGTPYGPGPSGTGPSGPTAGPGGPAPWQRPAKVKSGLAAVFDFSFVARATRTLARPLFWLVVAMVVIDVITVLVTMLTGRNIGYTPSGGTVFFSFLQALLSGAVKIALARLFLELCVNVSDLAQQRTDRQ